MRSFRNVMPGFGAPPDGTPPSDLEYDMWLGPAPKRPYNPKRSLYHFRWFWDYSGGQMTNLGAHDIDVVQWAMQVKGPAAVSSSGGRFALEDNGETPDTQDALFEYPGFTTVFSMREASAGNITQAEVATDRAAAVVTGARFKGESAPPGFFETAIRQLDQIVAVHPENARLGEHAALMRIELAQFRSALEASPADSGQSKHVGIGAPRTIARDSLLDPKSLGGKILDATLMPASAEILEPPASRLFVDNVRVENLTIAGATQTLDGMHWKNVTFMGTRLRYEGGEVDLENVHFVRCKFGFTTDERGVRLANTIALGQTSLVIE